MSMPHANAPSIENLRYHVEVLKDEDHIEEVIARISNLTIARVAFDIAVIEYPGKLIMLCQKGRVLRRSDRPA